jgi:hypothetical protein
MLKVGRGVCPAFKAGFCGEDIARPISRHHFEIGPQGAQRSPCHLPAHHDEEFHFDA